MLSETKFPSLMLTPIFTTQFDIITAQCDKLTKVIFCIVLLVRFIGDNRNRYTINQLI